MLQYDIEQAMVWYTDRHIVSPASPGHDPDSAMRWHAS